MKKEINKWITVTNDENLLVVDINLDLNPKTPKARYHESLVRDILQDNGYNPGACLQTSKVFNNRAVAEDSGFLSGTFKFINESYVRPKKVAVTKTRTKSVAPKTQRSTNKDN